MLTLRPYQEKALTDLWGWFQESTGNPLVVLPTGAGKSLVIAEWCKLVFETDPDASIIVVTHVRELVRQNSLEMSQHWPEAPIGIYAAGLNRRDIAAPLIFASIQSVHNKAYQIPRRVDMVLVDEAHLIPRNADTMYGRFLSDLRTINPAVKIIGMTATPYRVDSGRLEEGDGAMFDGIAHETSVRSLIDEGYLSAPIGPADTGVTIDTKGIGTRAGDFIASQLEAKAMAPETISAIAERIVASGQDRKGWIVFGCTVAHCEALVKELNSLGYEGCGVYGDSDKSERDQAIADFKAQKLRFLVSKDVLTVGFNARHVDLVAIARPTKSTGLYIQIVGRGTRLSPETGKENCLVLDFGGNIARHGPFDDPRVPNKRKRKDQDDEQDERESPFKSCPECQNACSPAALICGFCGFEFPPPEPKVFAAPAKESLLSKPPEWLTVTDVTYGLHQKQGKPDSLRVTYRVGMTFFKEWVCLNHTGYARTKAESWWMRRGNAPVPRNVDEALARTQELARPTAIMVKRDGDFDTVTSHKFEQQKAYA